MKLMNRVIGIGLALLSSQAFANRYVPQISCENGQVIVDEVYTDDPAYNHLQLIIHGADLAERVKQTMNGIAGILYGDTRVLEYDFNSLNTDKSDVNGLRFNGQELKATSTYFREGGVYSGNYIFRNCNPIK